MTLTLEQFQKDALPWLAKLNQTGETLMLVAGDRKFEVRPAPRPPSANAEVDLQKLLPKRDIIIGDPEDLVHLDWSSEWRP